MIASPVILLAAIGVQARTYTDNYEFPRYSAHLERDIRAYTDVLRLSEMVNEADGSIAHANLVRQAARAWIEQSRCGKLKPLEPEFLSDAMNEGVKSQIFTASMGLCSDLMVQARDLARRGEYDAAANDLTLATELVQCLKYSDLVSVSAIATRQRGILRMVREYMPNLNRETKENIVARLVRVEESEKHVEPLLERSRGLFVQAKREESNDMNPDNFAKLVRDATPSDPNAIQVLAETPLHPNHSTLKSWNKKWSETRYVQVNVQLQRQVNRELIRDLRNQLALSK